MGLKNAIKMINIQKFYLAHFGPIPFTLVHQLFYNLLQMINMKRIYHCNNLISIILQSIAMKNIKQLFVITNILLQ